MTLVNAHIVNFDNVSIGGIDGVTILAVDPYKPPKRTLSSYLLARSDKSITNSAFYTEKQITVRVGVQKANRALMEVAIDNLTQILHGIEKELNVPQAGGRRIYTATLADTPVSRDGGSYCEIDLVFSCSDRFGYDTGSKLIVSATGATAGSRTDEFTFEGSAPWQQPVITLTFTSIANTSDSRNVIVGNGATGQQVTISRVWTAGDVLVIDAPNNKITVNGTEVPIVGAIPQFAPGIGYLTYSDTFSSRVFNLMARYTRRWS